MNKDLCRFFFHISNGSEIPLKSILKIFLAISYSFLKWEVIIIFLWIKYSDNSKKEKKKKKWISESSTIILILIIANFAR